MSDTPSRLVEPAKLVKWVREKAAQQQALFMGCVEHDAAGYREDAERYKAIADALERLSEVEARREKAEAA